MKTHHTLALLGTLLGVLTIPRADAQTRDYWPPVIAGTLNSAQVNESSGLVASRLNPGVLWVHNDGGDRQVYAVRADGTHLSTWIPPGLLVVDFEDIAIGPGPVDGRSYLYLGDIGDNFLTHTNMRVIRVPEPIVATNETGPPPLLAFESALSITLAYPDFRADAEALMCDPISGDLFVATKNSNFAESRIYRAPKAALDAGGSIRLEYMRTVRLEGVTGADISADGREIFLRTESQVVRWKRLPSQTVAQTLARGFRTVRVVGPPAEANGEGIAVDPFRGGYYTVGEGLYQPLYYFGRRALPSSLTLLRDTQAEQTFSLSLKGLLASVDGARPQKLKINNAALLAAWNGLANEATPPFGRGTKLMVVTTLTGTPKIIARKRGMEDLDVTEFFPEWNLGNDRPDAVIVQTRPTSPPKVYTVADVEIAYPFETIQLDLFGPTINTIRTFVLPFLGRNIGFEANQSASSLTGWWMDQGIEKATINGRLKLGSPRLPDTWAYLAEDFDAWDGGFLTTGLTTVGTAWTHSPTNGIGQGGAWRVDGASNPGSRVSSMLTSRPVLAAKDGTVALVFDHRHSFQSSGATHFDGGQVRVSVNLGPFVPVPPEALEGHGYSGVIVGSNDLQGQEAFAGESPGHANGDWVRTAAVLGRFQTGDVITFAFFGAWDVSVRGAVPNWEVQNAAVIPWTGSVEDWFEP